MCLCSVWISEQTAIVSLYITDLLDALMNVVLSVSGIIVMTLMFKRATRWCSWLTHCATSRKVAGSIPDGGTGIFH